MPTPELDVNAAGTTFIKKENAILRPLTKRIKALWFCVAIRSSAEITYIENIYALLDPKSPHSNKISRGNLACVRPPSLGRLLKVCFLCLADAVKTAGVVTGLLYSGPAARSNFTSEICARWFKLFVRLQFALVNWMRPIQICNVGIFRDLSVRSNKPRPQRNVRQELIRVIE